jgi:hypothetical protein
MGEASSRIGRAHQALAHGAGLVQALALVQTNWARPS